MTPSRIEWLSDLVRLEITLWNQIDARLREEHGQPLAFFWPLYVLSRAGDESLRIGELADALGITVGGASKIVDRIERTGLLRRAPDAADRRASRVVLTDAGRSYLAEASETYEAEMATLLDAGLSADQQRDLHRLVRQFLNTIDTDEPA
jgi:DNA-binding MarR family transcriptional regulator